VAGRDHFRAHARRPSRTTGTLSTAVGGLDSDQPVRVVDIGLGGASVELSDAPPLGARISLSLEAPHRWEPLVFEGRVAWAEPGPNYEPTRIGIEFGQPTSVTLRALVDLLEADIYE